jgi:hypothetical protein
MFAAQVDYTSMVANIRSTSKVMTRLTLGVVVSFVGCALTFPSSVPMYPAQNSLPRVLQGQISYFAANACALGIVFHIVAYMQYGGRKQPSYQIKPNDQKSSIESRSKSDSSQLQHRISPLTSISGSSGSAAKRRSGRVRFASQPELNENSKNLQDLMKRPSLPSAGAQPFVPIILATLQPSSTSGRSRAERAPASKYRDGLISEGCCVSGTAVMDMGDGILRDVDSKTLGNEAAAGVLTKGSHAFVKCYGERHLRCVWHAFDFGFAGKHSLLANSNVVLMSGEIEVDASGNVTRWLMSQCGQAMPPWWAVVHSGLPITSAWAFIAGSEVDALSSPDCTKENLIAEGILECLNEATPTTNRFQRDGASTPVEASGPNRSLQGKRTPLSPIGTTSEENDDLHVGMNRPTIDSDHENNDSVGSSSPSRSGTAETGASVVPSGATHTEEIWVMKLGDDFEWHVSVSRSIYARTREALASCDTLARELKLRFQRHQCQRPPHRHRRQVSPDTHDDHRQQQQQQQQQQPCKSSSSGSDNTSLPVKWGLGDLEAGWTTELEDTGNIVKDEEECRDATQARLQDEIEADIGSNFSRRQKASSALRRVHLEKILETAKEGPIIADRGVQGVPEEKGEEEEFSSATSHGGNRTFSSGN